MEIKIESNTNIKTEETAPTHLNESDGSGVNYITRVQALISKILIQFTKIADKDRAQKRLQEQMYSKSNKEFGDYQREIGDRGFNFTLISLGFMGSQFLLPVASRALNFPLSEGAQKVCQEVGSFLSNQGCTNLASMFNSETQAKQKQTDAVAQLAMSEMNAMMNKGSSDASNKDQFIRVLDELGQSIKRAAQSS